MVGTTTAKAVVRAYWEEQAMRGPTHLALGIAAAISGAIYIVAVVLAVLG
ncbi:hypothetical protein LCGC14_1022710 [marine sediment metagenome]|uniref:Uncharacterized protein n=1 Tax=marine sediment metagenome TaxID=412755 RepID=A0A0F9R2X4_9ZZZZ